MAIYYGCCLITWKSKRQLIVALSTTESEMIAIVDTYKELRLAQKSLSEINVSNKKRIIYSDNQPYIIVASKNGYSGRAKHIELRYLAIQGYVSKGNSV